MWIGLVVGSPEVPIPYDCNRAEPTVPHFQVKLGDPVKAIAAPIMHKASWAVLNVAFELAVSGSPELASQLI